MPRPIVSTLLLLASACISCAGIGSAAAQAQWTKWPSQANDSTKRAAQTEAATRIASRPAQGSFRPFQTQSLDEPPTIPKLGGAEPQIKSKAIRAINEAVSPGGAANSPKHSTIALPTRSAAESTTDSDPSSLGGYPLYGEQGSSPRPTYQTQLRQDVLEQESVRSRSILQNGAKAFNAPHRTRPQNELWQEHPQLAPDTAPNYTQPNPAPYVDSAPYGHSIDGVDLIQPPSAANQLGTQVHPRPSSNPGVPQIPNKKEFWQQFPKWDPADPKTRTEGYNTLGATLSNGFWFAGAELLYFEPMFQDNNAFVRTGGALATADKVDFGFDSSFRGYFGFETNAGPAVKFTWTRLSEFSTINQFTFTASESALTRIDLGTADTSFELGAGANPGSQLTVQQQIKLHLADAVFFKDQINPVSRVRGNVGLRYVTLQQTLFAGLDDPIAGSTQARNINDYYGLGPRLSIEYFRPIGHSNFELQSGFTGSLIFGRRDQSLDVTGVGATNFRQLGKVEPMSIFELYLGVQWNIKVSKCQRVFFRSAMESQLWAGSDTALDVGSDLGFYGLSFGFGVTR